MQKDSDSDYSASGEVRPHSSVTRRKLIQTAAMLTGGGVLAGSVLQPKALLAASAPDAASSLTRDRIAATPTFKYRPYRSRRATAADTTSWVQIDLGQSQSIDEIDRKSKRLNSS